MFHGFPLDWWNSGTSLINEGGMLNGRSMDVHWTGRMDRPVGQRLLKVRYLIDAPWTPMGLVKRSQVDRVF